MYQGRGLRRRQQRMADVRRGGGEAAGLGGEGRLLLSARSTDVRVRGERRVQGLPAGGLQQEARRPGERPLPLREVQPGVSQLQVSPALVGETLLLLYRFRFFNNQVKLKTLSVCM